MSMSCRNGIQSSLRLNAQAAIALQQLFATIFSKVPVKSVRIFLKSQKKLSIVLITPKFNPDRFSRDFVNRTALTAILTGSTLGLSILAIWVKNTVLVRLYN